MQESPKIEPTSNGGAATTIWTKDGVPIQVSLVNNDESVCVSGPQDSVLVPVAGLNSRPDETGYVGEQVQSAYRAKVAANDAGDGEH